VDFSKLKKEYLKGGTSYRKLAEKYDVPLSTLKTVAGKEGWVELRNQTKTKTDLKTIEIISDGEAERARRLLSASDRLLDRIEEIIEELTTAEVLMDRTTLKQITGAMLDIQKIQGSKDALDIEEQRARIAKLRKEAEDEEKTNEIGIVIEGGDSSWEE
jgi:uncharacterized protein YjcR